MTLWIILTVMAAIAAAVLTVPLVRRHEARADARSATLAVLKDQLADVDVQLAAGTIAPGDADGLRTEIKRRMLAAGHIAEDAARPFSARALGGVAIGLAAMVGLAAAAMYAGMGQPGIGGVSVPVPPGTQAGADQAGAPGADPRATAEIAALITGLEKKMATTPNEPQGWQMLGWSYFQTGRYDDAVTAYGKAVALKPDGAGYQSAYGEALVQVANGTVTPAAEAAFAKAKAQDGRDARARYFLGLARQQRGDAKGALDDWLGLLADSPADAPWLTQLRGVIDETSKAAGIDVSARVAAIVPPASGGATVTPPPMAATGAPPMAATGAPPMAATGAPPMAGAAAPGPTAEQVAGAQQMAPADQQAMIKGMVDRLAGRLAANPRDEAGWLRLMRARMVLGEGAEAARARDAAVQAFAGDAATQGRIRAAATELGIAG